MKAKFLIPSLFALSLIAPTCGPVGASQKSVTISSAISRTNSYSEHLTLRVLSSEDYIYIQDIDNGYEEEDLVDQFVEYAKENGFENVEVVYDTSDTNETIYSELKTGKSDYDVVNVSDYMAGKLAAEDIAYKLTDDDKALVPHYFGENHTVSGRLRDTLGDIQINGKENEYLRDYTVGYMWGTLGILFNPSFKTFDENHRNISMEEIANDMRSWNALWDSKYQNTFTIKDSMRDTYAVGVLYTYQSEILEIQKQYQEDLKAGKAVALAIYQAEFSKIFNRCEQENIDEVSSHLRDLKNNSFGLEVDSGKQDIVTGKIGLNLAWSGDAVYAMELAAEETGDELYYSLPEIGSNLWFDTWIIPKNDGRSQAQKELTLLWLDFLSDPTYASQNMDYTGYTSFCGGDDILELARDWYDYRTNYVYATEDYFQVYYEADGEEIALDYCDMGEDFAPITENPELYYYEDDDPEEGEKVSFVDPMWEDEETEAPVLHYNDLETVLDDVEVVDLSYFFEGTLDEYEDGDMIFYSDCYLPFNNDENTNLAVGREFFCQYPDLETINRCSVMKDYGNNNKHVVEMWESFKSDPLPTWAGILLGVEAAAILLGVGYYVGKKLLRKRIRHKRKMMEENQ